MSTKITVTYKDENYVLEFSRDTAKQIEDLGFVAGEVSSKPATMIPLLVYGAFQKNNRGIKRKLVDEIYQNLTGKLKKDGEEGFIAILTEMYAETVSSLMEDAPADEGNTASWVVTRG